MLGHDERGLRLPDAGDGRRKSFRPSQFYKRTRWRPPVAFGCSRSFASCSSAGMWIAAVFQEKGI